MNKIVKGLLRFIIEIIVITALIIGISANNTTIWWNNKTYIIKDKELFVNLTEGIFFLEDLQTE